MTVAVERAPGLVGGLGPWDTALITVGTMLGSSIFIGAALVPRALSHPTVVPLAVAVLLQLFGLTHAAQVNAPATYGYRVDNVYPHDSRAYTQGLIYLDGFLFESTGLNGRSTLRKVKLETGEVIRQVPIDSPYFAEGLTDWHGLLVQLTWQSHVGFIYEMSTLNVQRTFTYSGEGWGLTRDRTRLIMSDGSDSVRFFDPETLRETGRVTVRDGSLAIKDLNELEYVCATKSSRISGTRIESPGSLRRQVA